MNRVPDKSVDMILCDLPYGTTRLKWDVVIPFAPLWGHYERVIKDNGAIILTATQPFTTDLINSNRRLFKYDTVWQKTCPVGFLDAKRRPLRVHENVLIFYKKTPVYNPQMEFTGNSTLRKTKKTQRSVRHYDSYSENEITGRNDGFQYPRSIITISNKHVSDAGGHPTPKPIEFFSYLIRTYTNPGDTVLDNCMGSGTTAISCIQEGRNFVGFELNKEYYDIATDRIEKELARPEQLKLIV